MVARGARPQPSVATTLALFEGLDQNGRATGWTAMHQWRANGSWIARRDIPRSALLPAAPGADQRFAWIERATPAGQAVAWIASMGRWRRDPPRRETFVAQRLRPGDIEVERLPLETGELAKPLQIRPAGIQQQQVLSFQASLPAWSLAGDQHQLFVGLGHPPFQSEPLPGRCHTADRASGTVLRLRRL